MRIAYESRHALLTYCTNVHPIDDLADLVRTLDTTTASVARTIAPGERFGLGLRLGADQIAEITRDRGARARLEEVFARHRFFPFTINAFPQGRFHERRVKHAVYRPDWCDPARARYTLDVARLLAEWLPAEDRFGTISTLPIGWRSEVAAKLDDAGRAVRAVAAGLARIEAESGARIMLCLEPEPGCALETMADVVAFFEGPLLTADSERTVRRHVGVCYDACHQAVLFENHDAALDLLARAGIAVGKVQISSALAADCGRPEALQSLVACDEERFLHQVAVRSPKNRELRRFDDLPDLQEALSGARIEGEAEARCHFHVPIHAESFPPLRTTRADLLAALAALRKRSDVRHFEVETYTFHVLPPALRGAPIEAHLVAELAFAKQALSASG